jgi:hypothetical protein
MTKVSWEEFKSATKDSEAASQYHCAGVHYEDYWLGGVLWRYCWTEFDMNGHPAEVEVNNLWAMTGDDE